MPIYVYDCENDGPQDVFSRTFDILPERPCPKCGKGAKMAVTAPARHDIERTWNDKANEYRRDPYTQSKAQLTNLRRETVERTERDCDRPTSPITEEAIQVGAKAIAAEKANPRQDLEQRQVAQVRKARKAKAKAL